MKNTKNKILSSKEKDVVIGLGEIGTPILQLLSKVNCKIF